MFVQDDPQNNQSQSKPQQQPPAVDSQADDQQSQSHDYVNTYQPPQNGQQTQSQSEPEVQQVKQTVSSPQENQQEKSMQADTQQQTPSESITIPKNNQDQSSASTQQSHQQQNKSKPTVSPDKPSATMDHNQQDQQASVQKKTAPQTEQPTEPSVSETLEDQNIFVLLGVDDGSTQEKERFLDELQQVIWEDFLENDVELLVTSQEKEKVDAILNNNDLSDLEKQEQIIVYLEELIPDLEEIMLEKALELKQDMVKERIEGMREYYQDDKRALNQINQASRNFAQGKWASGAEILNRIK